MSSLQDQAIHTTLSGDWEQSITLNKALIEENPDDIQAHNRLAFALNILGRNRDARNVYQKVLDLDPLNQIALRNIKRLNGQSSKQTPNGHLILSHHTFLEEAGKTKVIELINIAPSQVTNGLRPGETVQLSIKRLKIFVLTQEKKFIGMLPDDIAKRLIKFINAGNTYEVYIKSCSGNYITIFIKELKRSARFKDQPSFLLTSEKQAPNNKMKKAKQEEDQEEPEEES